MDQNLPTVSLISGDCEGQKHMIYTIFIDIKLLNEPSCPVDMGGVIQKETTLIKIGFITGYVKRTLFCFAVEDTV